MTALEQYERLESGGIWREDADAQRRDVLVSFGDATLVIADTADRPIAHWSLPAIVRLNEGERPALFAPDPEAAETLEIEDNTMIDAIEQIRRGLLKARPKPGRLRYVLTGCIVLILVALGLFWFPNALRQQTLSVVPQSKRAEMAAIILGHVQSQIGMRCETPRGSSALNAMSTRIFGPETRTQIIVLPKGIGEAVTLPGGLVALDQTVVETAEGPELPAGFALAAFAATADQDPLGAIIDHAGLQPTLQLLTSGDLPRDALESYADTLIATPQTVEITQSIAQSFDLAQVPLAPLQKRLTERGHTGVDLVGDVVGDPIITDSQWIALQGICDGY